MNCIDKTKQVLLEKGWCKNSLYNEKGERCLVGAFEIVYPIFAGEDPWTEWSNGIESIIRTEFPERQNNHFGLNLVEFNNHPDTTFDDIILVLEKASARYEEMH